MKYFKLRFSFPKRAGNVLFYLAITICLFPNPGLSQTNDIKLPTVIGGGSMALDVITANGYIFIYTAAGVQVFNQTNNSHVQTIPFNPDFDYGKFNPMYHNERLHFGAVKLMDYNENSNIIYAIFPDLKIKGISTNPPFFNIVSTFDPLTQEPPGGLQGLAGYFAPLHHACILKYDHYNHRLYWLIYGRDPDDPNNECPGNFHAASRFFAIFDEQLGSLSYYYTELVDHTGDYYDKNISDIVFNTSDYLPQKNFFYLSKLNKIEVWEIIGNNQVVNKAIVPVENSIYGYSEVDPFPPHFYKFSKMLYVNNANVHQVIALPYRYPSSILEEGKVPLVYILDGNWDGMGNIETFTFTAPSERICDGLHIHPTTNDDLILSYVKGESEYLTQWQNTDIAIYRYNNSSNNYQEEAYFDTDNSLEISEYDINTSFKLLYNNSTATILVGKKDEVAKIVYNSSLNQYELLAPILEAESNFFRFGVTAANRQYFVNTVSNGLEVFTNSQHSQSIPLGYPVYHIAGNSDGSKLCFFNTLQAQNTGLYIYTQSNEQAININSDGIPGNNVDKSIGDCVYNPFKNHFLVSEYGDFGASPAIVRVIDGGSTNAHVQDIALTYNNQDAQYPKEMFISPEGKLYVMVNMHREVGSSPKIFEFSAFDKGTVPAYTFLHSWEVDMPPVSEQSDVYAAHFCYNSFNRTTYLTVHLTELTLDPYNTVINSMFDFDLPTENPVNNGKLLGIKDGTLTPIMEEIFFPGKMICPGAEYPQMPTDFNGKMYIIGKQFYEFDYALNDLDIISADTFNDITYSPYHDKMFGIKDTYFPGFKNQRKCEIYSIERIDGLIETTVLNSFPGQFSSITYNPYDNKVYLYRKIDDAKLGGMPVQIIKFDPGATPIVFEPVNCTFRSSYPDLDHDPDHHYYLYNITEPFLDPINNCIYFPGGGHSRVSRMEFVPDETIPLDPSRFTWMSFPRLDRIPNNPTVNDVLGGVKINPSNYLEFSYLENLPPTYTIPIRNTYNGEEWPEEGQQLLDINSLYGYKLQLLYDPENPPDKEWLHLFGDVFEATSPVEVYRRYDNWVGYWLYESQSPFDAFPPETLDQLRSIIHQNWTCGKYGSSPDGQEPPYYWLCACHKGKVQLRYSDMVILKTDEGGGSFSFQWQRYGNPIAGEEHKDPEYFSYTQQPEYTPYFIEMDTTQLPAEIGAFVNDTCVGATAVLEGDTLVLVPGYIDGMNGEVTFELYYDSLKSGRQTFREYFVKHPHTLRKERRTIHTMEKQDFFLISFKEKPEDAYFLAELPLSIHPNPSNGRFSIDLTLPQRGEVILEIFDLFGRKIHALSGGYLPAGLHQININLADADGLKVPIGVYLIHVRSEQYLGQAKLILIH